MKYALSILIIAVTAALLSSCRTGKVAETEGAAADTATAPLYELRCRAVMPEEWLSEDPDAAAGAIRELISQAADSNFNAVIFFVRNANDPLDIAVAAAHESNLKLYAGLNMMQMTRQYLTYPQKKVFHRQRVTEIVRKHDIDGLALLPSDLTPDILEDVFAEAMLMKPYLVAALVWGEAGEKKTAELCLEAGSVDLILSLDMLKAGSKSSWPGKMQLPPDLKRISATDVTGLGLAALKAKPRDGDTLFVNGRQRIKVAGEDGWIGLTGVRGDTLKIETGGRTFTIDRSGWFVPYRYSLNDDGSVSRMKPWVELRAAPSAVTAAPDFDFLFKTDYPARVKINGDSVKQYHTGIFFSRVRLNEGTNRVRAEVIMPDSSVAFYESEYVYEKRDLARKAFPLWIEARSIEPSSPLELLTGDIVRISFRGSLGQNGFVIVKEDNVSLKCARTDYPDYSLYITDLPVSSLNPELVRNITLRLEPAEGNGGVKPFEAVSPATVTLRNPGDFPMVKVISENTRLTYNLGEPRLGGPIRSELSPGVVMKVSGIIGKNYRIRLSSVEQGFVSRENVEVLPAGTVKPSYYITSMSCSPSNGADILTIPYPEPVPYQVDPEPEQNRIVITLFGVETSSTWVSHLTGRKVIDHITWEQTTPETYRIFVNLKTPCIWGYELKQEERRLVLRVKYPPVYDLASSKPLSGLKIAIEAGHGGSGMGAIGLSGLVEKEINLDLSFRLGDLLKSMGAEVIQVRDSDRDMGLLEKRSIAIDSGADILVSIHGNAGGRGYLQVGGTSTYWHNPFWEPLAQSVYDRLLELGLSEFGVVGSFNYTVTRASQMPAVLVEQAFLTHAEDEEKLADPAFRQQMATSIYEGLVDYLRTMQKECK